MWCAESRERSLASFAWCDAGQPPPTHSRSTTAATPHQLVNLYTTPHHTVLLVRLFVHHTPPPSPWARACICAETKQRRHSQGVCRWQFCPHCHTYAEPLPRRRSCSGAGTRHQARPGQARLRRPLLSAQCEYSVPPSSTQARSRLRLGNHHCTTSPPPGSLAPKPCLGLTRLDQA